MYTLLNDEIGDEFHYMFICIDNIKEPKINELTHIITDIDLIDHIKAMTV